MEVDEFKDKLNKFISNCVRSAKIISEDAKTFGTMVDWIKRTRRNEKLHDYLAKEGITWKFNLSKAPWWGAIYERLIKRSETHSFQSHWKNTSHQERVQESDYGCRGKYEQSSNNLCRR